jgi:hypothetical protein
MDQEQFEAMLTRNGVQFFKSAPSHDHPGLTVIEIDDRSPKVHTMTHCYCEFRFNADGSLAEISYGY